MLTCMLYRVTETLTTNRMSFNKDCKFLSVHNILSVKCNNVEANGIWHCDVNRVNVVIATLYFYSQLHGKIPLSGIEYYSCFFLAIIEHDAGTK